VESKNCSPADAPVAAPNRAAIRPSGNIKRERRRKCFLLRPSKVLKISDVRCQTSAFLRESNPLLYHPYLQGILLSVITIFGALLRLQHLGDKSFWVDEAFSAFIAAAPWHNFWQQIQTTELNMLPYYLLLRLWIHFGSSEAWLRLLSALFGIVSIPLIYLLSSRLFCRRVGLLAAALLAVHPGHIIFSQEARSYSMTVLLLVIVAVLLLNAIANPKRLCWGAYALAAGAAIYSHFFAVLAVSAQLIGIGKRPTRQHLRAALIPLSALGLLALPIGLFALNHDVGQLSGTLRPQFHHVLRVIFLLTGNGMRCVLYLLLWIVAGWQSFRLKSGAPARESATPYSFLLAWLFAPLLITLLLSFWKAALLPRYLLVSLPAAVILAAAGAVHLPKKPALLLIALLMALSLKSVVSYYHRPKRDWRSAIQRVASNSQPGDAVAIMPTSSAVVFDYYCALRSRHCPHLLKLPVDEAIPAAARIWVVTTSRPLKTRSQPRKESRWREAEAELEQLLSAVEPAYRVTEIHDSYGVRVLLLSR
jgi:mannosyltransferase